MGVLREGKRVYHYDEQVTVPYGETGEGEVTFFLRWVPYMGATASAPEEGGHWETIHIQGFHYDDDLPDLEAYAFGLASENAEARREAHR